jgi:hypothetical protein
MKGPNIPAIILIGNITRIKLKKKASINIFILDKMSLHLHFLQFFYFIFSAGNVSCAY